MKTFLNILWNFPFLGFLVALFTAIGGLFWCITIVGLPLGLGLLQFSKFLLWPFGYAMVSKSDLETITEKERPRWWKIFALIVRILYFPFGLINVILMACLACVEFVTIAGIPCALVYIKSLGTYFNPINKVCVPEVVAKEIQRRKDENVLRKYTSSNTIASTPVAATKNSFCPNCGNPLAEGAKFCQSCGNPVTQLSVIAPTSTAPVQQVEPKAEIAAPTMANVPANTDAPSLIPAPTQVDIIEDESDIDSTPSVWEKHRWYIIGGATAIIAVIVLLISFAGSSDKEIGKKYVYTDNTTVYRLTDGELGEDPITELDFGHEVSVLSVDSLWVKVAIGRKKGFVPFSDLMDWEDFNPLRHAINSDKDLSSIAYTRNHRKALSAELKNRNTATLEYIGYSDSFDDGYYQNVPMIISDTSSGIREYVIYGFNEEDGKPIRLHSEIIPKGMSEVKNATYKKGKYKITYKRDKSATQKLEGADVFSGYIDGKYEIVMNLLNYGSHYKGVYYYTKNGTSIEIEGDMDDANQLTLTETVNGNVTGQFIGEYSWNEFSGYWISADGERALIFKVTKD